MKHKKIMGLLQRTHTAYQKFVDKFYKSYLIISELTNLLPVIRINLDFTVSFDMALCSIYKDDQYYTIHRLCLLQRSS